MIVPELVFHWAVASIAVCFATGLWLGLLFVIVDVIGVKLKWWN